MSLFRNKDRVTREEFREALRREDTSDIIDWQDINRLEREVLPYNKYGSMISAREVREVIRELTRERYATQDANKQWKIDEEIKLLKRIL